MGDTYQVRQGAEFSWAWGEGGYGFAWRAVYGTITKYKPQDKRSSIIGIKNPRLKYMDDHAVTSVLTTTIFDTTSRGDSARILLTNNHGVSVDILTCLIYGVPVRRLGDEEGWIHDNYVDYESIGRNGEIRYELGNDFIVTKAQVETCADYLWKFNRTKKHMYSITLPGFQSQFEPGEWYTLALGGAGQQEYINSTVECYAVRCSKAADGLGSTSVAFREVEQGFVHDSGETARYIASAQFGRRQQSKVLLVAADGFDGWADYYCDGIADQEEINAAIVALSRSGGGIVQLTRGRYYTTGSIDVDYSNIRLIGEGRGTVIEKNCNDQHLQSYGGIGARLTEVSVEWISFARNAADTNNNYAVLTAYSDNFLIRDCYFEDVANGIYLSNTTNSIVAGNVLKYSASWTHDLWGIINGASDTMTILNNEITGMVSSKESVGIVCFGDKCIITENYIHDIVSTGALNDCAGIWVRNDNCQVVNNVIDNCDNTGNWNYGWGIIIGDTADYNVVTNNRASNNSGRGIYVAMGATVNKVNGNTCYANGSDAGYANVNQHNFQNDGTDTQVG